MVAPDPARRRRGMRSSSSPARRVRAFADGFVSVLLPVYLLELGFGVVAIGAIVTATLIGSALLTLWVGDLRASS